MSASFPSGFSVEPAQLNELNLVQGILLERCRWLAQRRIEQWPASGFADEIIEAAIAQGSVYLARIGKEIAGTITVNDEDSLWGDQPAEAKYLRRMATHRSWDGRGVGAAMTEWAAQKGIDEGMKYLRLACVMGQGALPRYYTGLGFEKVAERTGDFPAVAMMQRPLYSET